MKTFQEDILNKAIDTIVITGPAWDLFDINSLSQLTKFRVVYPDTTSLHTWIQSLKNVPNKIIINPNIFYLKSLYRGYPDTEISQRTKNFLNTQNSHQLLKSLLPDNKIHRNNKLHIQRHLEFYIETGYEFHNYPNKYKENLYIIWNDTKNLDKLVIKRIVNNGNNDIIDNNNLIINELHKMKSLRKNIQFFKIDKFIYHV